MTAARGASPGALGYPAPHHPLRGIAWFMAGVFLFACMDTITKYLASRYPPPVVVAFRYIVQLVLMVVVLVPTQGRALVRTRRTGMVLARAACLAVGSLFFALALQRMPVAETSAVVFIAPLIVVLLAGPFLGERVGAVGWIAAIAGFGGVLLIARPGGGLDATGIVFALCAAATTAIYQLLSRVLASTETTNAMLFHTALVGSAIFGLLLPWTLGGGPPTALVIVLFLVIGALGGIGHFLYTAAHRHANASTLAPLQYSQLVWAGLLGWIVFDHVPHGLSMLGMAIVAGAGALVALRSRLAALALEQASES